MTSRMLPGHRSTNGSRLCWACLRPAGNKALCRSVSRQLRGTHTQPAYNAVSSTQHAALQSRPDEIHNYAWRSRPRLATSKRQIHKGSASATGTLRQRRGLHGGARLQQDGLEASSSDASSTDPARLHPNIREHLKLWQEVHGHPNLDNVDAFQHHPSSSGMLNQMIRRSADGRSTQSAEDREEAIEEENNLQIELPDDLGLNRRQFVYPGDLVEISNQGGEPIVAVHIQDFQNQSQFFTVQGRWLHLPPVKVLWYTPGYIDLKLLKPLIPYLPSSEVTDDLVEVAKDLDLSVPRHISGAVVDILADYQRKAVAVYRKNAEVLDNAYRLLADKERDKMMTIYEIAEKLLGDTNPSPEVLSAVRKAVTGGIGSRYDARSFRITGLIHFRSVEEMRMVSKVQRWIRNHQERLAIAASNRAPTESVQENDPIAEFAAKARRIVGVSRTMREATQLGSVGPSRVRLPVSEESMAVREIFPRSLGTFNDNDRAIIIFLMDWSLSRRFAGVADIVSLGPAILKAVSSYEGYVLNENTGFLFLQELGVLVPYENRVIYHPELMLPTTRFSKEASHLYSAAWKKERIEKTLTDSMEDLRHDWKNMPAYCIDDAGAHEIDDGLSIEKVPGKSEYWVHVHIANPTAFFEPDNVLGKLSEHMTETVYTPERAFAMLPVWATNLHFSLDSNRPTLTVSAKLDEDGAVLEKQIRPGIVRNVVNITPHALTKSLGKPQRDDEVTLTVGGDVPTLRERRKLAATLEPEDVKNLQMLHSLANARVKKRKAAGGMSFNMAQPELSVFQSATAPGLAWNYPSLAGPRFIEGDPIIHMRSRKFRSPFDSSAQADPANSLVQEMMLLACEVAASWCEERNIPIMYRGTAPKPNEISQAKFEEDILQHSLDENGQIPFHVGLRYLSSRGMTTCSTTPYEHKILGLSRYAKVTSPLRRYGDMVTHWQIEEALRAEAKAGRSLAGEPNHISHLFTREHIERKITRLSLRERLVSKSKGSANRFWLCQLLFRAKYFGEAQLPQTFNMLINGPTAFHQDLMSGIITEYSLAAMMKDPKLLGMEECTPGDVWEVALKEVHVNMRSILFEPVRRISKSTVPDIAGTRVRLF